MRPGCGRVHEKYSIGHGCGIAVVGAARTRAERYARCPGSAAPQTQCCARCLEFVIVHILSSHVRGFVGFVVPKLCEYVYVFHGWLGVSDRRLHTVWVVTVGIGW